MAEDNKVLDLEEALGEKKSVVIRRGEAEYRMKDVDAFSTFQLLQIKNLRRRIAILQAGESVTEKDAEDLEEALGDVLRMLSDELPADLSYTEKTAILAFYFMEVRGKKARSPMR